MRATLQGRRVASNTALGAARGDGLGPRGAGSPGEERRASASGQRQRHPKDGWRRGAEEAKRQPSRCAESQKERARSFCLHAYHIIPKRLPGFLLMFPPSKAPVVAQDEAKRRFFFFNLFFSFFAVF